MVTSFYDFVVVLILIFQHDLLNLIYIVLLLVSFFLMYKDRNKASHIFNIIVLPYVLIEIYSKFLKLLIKSFAGFEIGFYILYFTGMLVLLVPVTIRDYSSLK